MFPCQDTLFYHSVRCPENSKNMEKLYLIDRGGENTNNRRNRPFLHYTLSFYFDGYLGLFNVCYLIEKRKDLDGFLTSKIEKNLCS